jgi:hypothetical protein
MAENSNTAAAISLSFIENPPVPELCLDVMQSDIGGCAASKHGGMTLAHGLSGSFAAASPARPEPARLKW